MKTLPATLLEPEPTAAPAQQPPVRRAHRAIAVMVASAAVSTVCGVAQTLWIPRVLSVQAFGYWRAFLLYAGYAGLLHLGLVDGALLAWSATPAQTRRPQLAPALRFLAAEHLLLLLPLVGLAWVFAPRPVAVLIAALAVYALLFNLVGLLQVRLQTQLRFSAVAFGISAPSVVFVASFGVIFIAGATAGRFLFAWLGAWALTAAALFWLTRGTPAIDAPNSAAETPKPNSWRTGLAFIAAGWPIVLANTGYGLMQSADRVTVNLTRPIHDFAIYSLSQSTIYVPIAILAAVSRVAFSYFARTHETGRAAFYRTTTRLLTLTWMLLLPYFFVVEWVVRRFLPKYIDGLPAGRILLLSVLFLSLIQIVQLNAYSLEGRQRQFFAGSIAAVALAFATAWAGSRLLGSLTAVAWSQVLTAGVWWAGNEWFLQRRSLTVRHAAGVVVPFAIGAVALSLLSTWRAPLYLAVPMYYVPCAITLYLGFGNELRGGLRMASRLPQRLMGNP